MADFTPILFPDQKQVKTDKIHMMDFGGALKPSGGGPVQTIMRLGTRHAIDITFPTLHAEPDGRRWSAILRLAKLNGAILWFRQDNLVIGNPGNPVVAGDGQTGMTLNLRGFTASYPIRLGQAFSLVIAGRRYLYFAAADTVVSAAGNVALPIFPMLRVTPPDNSTAEFAKPFIQGSISGNEVAWERPTGGIFNFGTVSVSEDE